MPSIIIAPHRPLRDHRMCGITSTRQSKHDQSNRRTCRLVVAGRNGISGTVMALLLTTAERSLPSPWISSSGASDAKSLQISNIFLYSPPKIALKRFINISARGTAQHNRSRAVSNRAQGVSAPTNFRLNWAGEIILLSHTTRARGQVHDPENGAHTGLELFSGAHDCGVQMEYQDGGRLRLL